MISIVSWPLTIVVYISHYFYQDWEFAKWIAVAIVVDTFLSLWKHLLHKDASSGCFFGKFSKKIGIYICASHYVKRSCKQHGARFCSWCDTMDKHLYLCVYAGKGNASHASRTYRLFIPYCRLHSSSDSEISTIMANI